MSKLHIALIVIYIIVTLLTINYTVQSVYDKETYDTAKATDWLWRARATNDLDDMAKYLNKSLELLKEYDGNPVWIQPTPATDIQLIKDNIQECIDNCKKYNNLSDFAYQQAVTNLQVTITEIADHVGIVTSWYYWTPIRSVIVTSLMWLWLVFLIMYMFADEF